MGTLLLVALLDFAGIGLVFPLFSSLVFAEGSTFLPPETGDGVRGLWVGLLLALSPLVQFFSSPFLGSLSDRYGRKSTLMGGIAIGIVGYLLAAFAVWIENLSLLVFSRALIGFSAGTLGIATAYMADITPPEEKTQNFSYLNGAVGLGFMIGPFCGGMLSKGGFALPFIAAAAVVALNLLLIFFVLENRLPVASTKPPASTLKNIVKSFSLPSVGPLFQVAFLYSFGWSVFWDFSSVTWISEYGFDVNDVGNLYAFGSFIFAISCAFLTPPLLKRFSHRKMLKIALFALGFSIAGMSFAQTSLSLWLWAAFQNYLLSMTFPLAAAMVSNASEKDNQGERIGTLSGTEGLAFGLSTLLPGPLLGYSVYMPFYLGSVVMIGAGIVAMQIKTKELALETP